MKLSWGLVGLGVPIFIVVRPIRVLLSQGAAKPS